MRSSATVLSRGERGWRHLPLEHPAPTPVGSRMLAAVDVAVVQHGESYTPSRELKQQMQPDVTSSQDYPFHLHTCHAYQHFSPSPAPEEKPIFR